MDDEDMLMANEMTKGQREVPNHEIEEEKTGRNDCVDLIRLYLKEISHHKLLSRDEELALARKMKQGDLNARQQLIQCTLCLAVGLAKKYMNRGVDLADLIEDGNLGLMHAQDKFEPARGFRLSTYAT